MDLVQRYPFNLPWPAVAIGTLVYAGLSLLLVHWARHFEGFIFIVLIGLSVGFAMLAVIMATRRLVFPRALELTDDAILFPHGFPRTRITRIPYAEIIRVIESVGSASGLRMITSKGSFEITASYLPGAEIYLEVRDFVCSKSSIVLPPPNQTTLWREAPDPILSWVEPEDWPRYRTHLVTSGPLWPRLAKLLRAFVCWFGVFMLPWLLLFLLGIPTNPVAGHTIMSAGVALFFAALGWLSATHPARRTKISLRDKGITQLSGKQDWAFGYQDIIGWTMVERQFKEQILHILLLKLRTYETAFVLPDASTRDRVAQVFREKGVAPAPDLKPLWESRR